MPKAKPTEDSNSLDHQLEVAKQSGSSFDDRKKPARPTAGAHAATSKSGQSRIDAAPEAWNERNSERKTDRGRVASSLRPLVANKKTSPNAEPRRMKQAPQARTGVTSDNHRKRPPPSIAAAELKSSDGRISQDSDKKPAARRRSPRRMGSSSADSSKSPTSAASSEQGEADASPQDNKSAARRERRRLNAIEVRRNKKRRIKSLHIIIDELTNKEADLLRENRILRAKIEAMRGVRKDVADATAPANAAAGPEGSSSEKNVKPKAHEELLNPGSTEQPASQSSNQAVGQIGGISQGQGLPLTASATDTLLVNSLLGILTSGQPQAMQNPLVQTIAAASANSVPWNLVNSAFSNVLPGLAPGVPIPVAGLPILPPQQAVAHLPASNAQNAEAMPPPGWPSDGAGAAAPPTSSNTVATENELRMLLLAVVHEQKSAPRP